jgi:predicted metal-dependent HD superfamily phosphohydrolase
MELRYWWVTALDELGVDPGESLRLRASLTTRYEESHRFYHTNEHIIRLLQSIQVLSDRTPSPALVLSGLYHDAIYEIGAPANANEVRSALLMVADLGDLLPNYVLREISGNIIATYPGDYKNPPRSLDEALLRDADLAGFVDHKVEAANSVKIRKEFGQFSDEEYDVGRKAFLQSMLDLPQLYWSPAAIDRGWEESARANIAAGLRPSVEALDSFERHGWST